MRIAYFIGVAILALVIFWKPRDIDQQPSLKKPSAESAVPNALTMDTNALMRLARPSDDDQRMLKVVTFGKEVSDRMPAMTPFGPCGAATYLRHSPNEVELYPYEVELNPEPKQGSRLLFDNPTAALHYLVTECFNWYIQEKAARDAAESIQENR
jgi:hypothetical protein